MAMGFRWSQGLNVQVKRETVKAARGTAAKQGSVAADDC